MSLLIALALLIGIPASADDHTWDDKSKSDQCTLIARELQEGVRAGLLSPRDAQRIEKRCYTLK